ncbi:hypothetical protein M378DRAFT_17845 [Amanita muscaria Koide BX008]|uniref:Uncharacterized protein n=1 Tax=Amanita muscaria (strain Koide BX008) TaxID=946122 RepID=A0A0C2RYW9_AMAMK|nr:hypothetical protein M378DRAFT_17845 [Amanita muscaria Koide BX008]
MFAACSYIMVATEHLACFVAIIPAARWMLSNLLAIKSGLRCRWRRASNALETKRGHISLPRPSDSSLYTLEGALAQ